jgi:hypothetical protein
VSCRPRVYVCKQYVEGLVGHNLMSPNRYCKINTRSSCHGISRLLLNPEAHYNVHWMLSCIKEFACHCEAGLACRQILTSRNPRKMLLQRQECVQYLDAATGSFCENNSHFCMVEDQHSGLLMQCLREICMKLKHNMESTLSLSLSLFISALLHVSYLELLNIF